MEVWLEFAWPTKGNLELWEGHHARVAIILSPLLICIFCMLSLGIFLWGFSEAKSDFFQFSPFFPQKYHSGGGGGGNDILF